MREPASDRPFQTPHAVEAAAADGLAGNQGEPAFDQVWSPGTGRSEVQMEARVGGEPARDRRMLVGAIVVADQMQLKSRITLGERFQEGDEFDVGVALEAPSMDLAAGHLQRGEQAGGAVARVVVSHTRGQSGPHRQRRLRAIKRLNLGLFIHAQHQGPLRWVQIEPDDIGQLAVELGVAAELEALDPVPAWSPYFCQMRWTVAGESLTSLASRRALQWVAALGLRSVALITACSLAEVMCQGPPARALVRKPESPSLR